MGKLRFKKWKRFVLCHTDALQQSLRSRCSSSQNNMFPIASALCIIDFRNKGFMSWWQEELRAVCSKTLWGRTPALGPYFQAAPQPGLVPDPRFQRKCSIQDLSNVIQSSWPMIICRESSSLNWWLILLLATFNSLAHHLLYMKHYSRHPKVTRKYKIVPMNFIVWKRR